MHPPLPGMGIVRLRQEEQANQGALMQPWSRMGSTANAGRFCPKCGAFGLHRKCSLEPTNRPINLQQHEGICYASSGLYIRMGLPAVRL